MSFDTGAGEHDFAFRLARINRPPSDTGELLPASKSIARQQGLEALLSYLDFEFGPLLDKAKLKPASAPSSGSDQDGQAVPPLAGPTHRDFLARDAFFASYARPPAPIATVHQPRQLTVKQTPRRGLGPAVFVGFDCEWTYSRMGRNRLLSVQFYLIGPTGERLSKVIDVAGGEALDARPSLAEVLDELLDEAEAECVFDEWPCEVILCGFFTRADLPVFRDAKKFIKQLQGVNGTLATVGKPARLDIPLNDARAIRLKDRYSFVTGDHFDPRVLSVRLLDASRLAPPGVSLSKIGEWLDLPKMELPPGFTKKEMARLQRERPDFFRAYGLRDAEIAVLYVLWVLWFSDRHLGLKGLSATASGLGVRLAQLCMRRDGVHPDIALNYIQTREWRWSSRTGKPTSFKKRTPTLVRQWFENFLADAYQGGRNECYWFGPTPVPHEGVRLYDHDLAGCYVVSLAGLMTLDYDRIDIVRGAEKDRLKGHVAGYAHVRFKFPADTRFPCLPVSVGNHGLWFPLSGESIATAPEIELAMMMGAEIEVLFGVVIPWMPREDVFERSKPVLRKKTTSKTEDEQLEFDGDAFVPSMQFPPESHGDCGYRPFESFAQYTRTERLKYRRKSLPNEVVKLIGNAAYGKTGQGFKDKRAFSPKEDGSVKIGPSAISEAAIAAMTSGFARAVLGEILWKLPPDALVVSATTDGLLVNVEHLDLTGPMCCRFQALVDRVAPDTGMTELKHLIIQAVAGRTRLQLTGKCVEGQDPVVAKGGIKVALDSAGGDEAKEKALLTPAGQNREMLELFVNRYPGQRVKRPSMMPMRDQLLKDWDLQMIDVEAPVSMEFDFKRRPVDARMIRIESLGVEHLAFNTEPWATTEEGELVRTLFDQWRRGSESRAGRCMKNMDDWADWQAFLGLYRGNRQRMRRHKVLETPSSTSLPLLPTEGSTGGAQVPGSCSATVDAAPSSSRRGVTGLRYATTKSSYLGIAIRAFMTAYVQRQWGLAGADLSQNGLAKWLTDAGYPTKLHDVKNAGRSQLYEHVVPRAPAVLAFLDVVKQRFPGLDVERFLLVM